MKHRAALLNSFMVGLGAFLLEFFLYKIGDALAFFLGDSFERFGADALFPSILLQSEFNKFGWGNTHTLVVNALFWAVVSYVFYFRKKT